MLYSTVTLSSFLYLMIRYVVTGVLIHDDYSRRIIQLHCGSNYSSGVIAILQKQYKVPVGSVRTNCQTENVLLHGSYTSFCC